MAQVTVSINNQSYTITCDDGQEDRLLELASYFDTQVQRIATNVGAIADSRLMLLAGLTICDELREAQMRIEELETASGMTSEDGAARVLNAATQKVREVTQRLEESSSNT
ncbi:cell division protein ZapA [Parvularcula sp. IMCC14364]|uniref:cell division protein ZapA n=1 Tax=Parvularcula sp. IMCC14364 TaxID=3067902 RepID=UPI002742950C|nr:cell division protein ZapA [Parvularcula sp. IMCC14364]